MFNTFQVNIAEVHCVLTSKSENISAHVYVFPILLFNVVSKNIQNLYLVSNIFFI